MCNLDCLNCTLPDCEWDETSPNTNNTDNIIIKEIEKVLDYDAKENEAINNGTYVFFRYNHSEEGKQRKTKYNHSEKGKAAMSRYNQSGKGKARTDRYNESDKGKARLQKYYQSEKGRENERKKAERKRMKRLQQKGAMIGV